MKINNIQPSIQGWNFLHLWQMVSQLKTALIVFFMQRLNEGKSVKAEMRNPTVYLWRKKASQSFQELIYTGQPACVLQWNTF